MIFEIKKTTTAEELFRCSKCGSCDQDKISFICEFKDMNKICNECKHIQKVKFVGFD